MLNEDAGTAVGRLSSLDLTRRTPSGRLLSIRATGSGGSKTISPSTLQARFNRLRPQGVQQLLSTNFDLKWSTAEAVAQTQGVIPAPSRAHRAAAPGRAHRRPRPQPHRAPAAHRRPGPPYAHRRPRPRPRRRSRLAPRPAPFLEADAPGAARSPARQTPATSPRRDTT